MFVHHLDGCAPSPLASYLKALGVVRLVARQSDPGIRGWWTGDRFSICTVLDRQSLLAFFLDHYSPTPMFNPWGARSGFYSGSSEKSSRQLLGAISQSDSLRFAEFRAAIEVVRGLVDSLSDGTKPSDKDGEKRLLLTLAVRNSSRKAASAWMDSVIAVVDQSAKGLEQPSLLGTGGSEGSGSYTAAYMQALDECLLKRPRWDSALTDSLFGSSDLPGCRWTQSFGQFIPSGEGSPWDLLLAFEGVCAIRSGVSSRAAREGSRWLSSPFFMPPASLGYASSARLDEYALNKGKELPGRGEQWFPLWDRPVGWPELEHLFVEGRALARRGKVQDACSMARAAASLGVQRGISEFVRFGYLQRNNLATHFAVPLGRIHVSDVVAPRLPCLDDLDAWLPGIRREARAKGASGRLTFAERRLADALFAVTKHPDEPLRWQAVLRNLAGIEAVQVTGSGYKAGPVPLLRPEWVTAADDGSAEFRLALACALQAAGFTRDGMPVRGIRTHWLPLDYGRFAVSGTGAHRRLQVGPDVVLHGRSGLDDAIALVHRRLVESSQSGQRNLPLVAARRAAAHPRDLAAWVAGDVDPDRTMTLARALMAVEPARWAGSTCRAADPGDAGTIPDDAWTAIRLAISPRGLPGRPSFGADPAIFRRLESGDVSSALDLALRRLRSAGVTATIRAGSVPTLFARRWAAALAFPISRRTEENFVRRLDPNSLKEAHA